MDENLETNLDDILHFKRTFSLDKSPRKIQSSKRSRTIQKKKRSCCLTKLCRRKSRRIPITTVKEFLSTPTSSITPECRYCSSESALSLKLDPNNNHLDDLSHQSLKLFHAVELYLSSNSSLNEFSDCSSIISENHVIIQENKQLNRCEINEIIYAIHSSIDDEQERTETLDALVSSLREISNDLPMNIRDDDNQRPLPPPPGLGQIFVRVIMYEFVMRLFSFYLLILLSFGRLS